MKSNIHKENLIWIFVKSLYTCKSVLSGSRGLLDVSHCFSAFFINFLGTLRVCETSVCGQLLHPDNLI